MSVSESQTAHLVDPSPWPLQMSMVLGTLLSGMVMLMMNKTSKGKMGGEGVMMSLMGVMMVFTLWMSDMMSESMYTGKHTESVKEGMMMGYMLFLMSEVMVFVTMFWTVLNTTMSPNSEVMGMWPPTGMKEMEGLELPLNNTMMLLGSGVTMTMGHNKMMTLNKKSGLMYTMMTMMLSMWFTLNQYMEYKEATYTMNDSIYGSGFYAGTGLHGMHMMMGTVYMLYGMVSMYKSDMTNTHHMGYESGMIYWHFVDIVWLFLFMMVYNSMWT